MALRDFNIFAQLSRSPKFLILEKMGFIFFRIDLHYILFAFTLLICEFIVENYIYVFNLETDGIKANLVYL